MEQLFGKSYSSIGDTSLDLILKTRGLVKILWGNKFLDLIKDGKVCNSPITLSVSTKQNIGKSSGLYHVQEDNSIVLVISGKLYVLSNGEGTSYVSFFEEQNQDWNLKHLALRNIGFYYDSLEQVEADNITNGLVYVEGTSKLYIIKNGEIIEWQVSFPNPLFDLLVIEKSDSRLGAVIIKGEGQSNSLIVGSLSQLFSLNNLTIINTFGTSISIKVLNSEKILVNNEITLKANTRVNGSLITNNILSTSSTSDYGFRLYMLGDKSYLEVDNLLVRNSGKDATFLIYPKYWGESNNIIISALYIDDVNYTLRFLYLNNYILGDILSIYLPITLEETVSFLLLRCKVVSTSSLEALVSIEEVGLEDVSSRLALQVSFLTGNINGKYILSYGSNLDLNYTNDTGTEVITRIGNIKELPLNISLSQGDINETATPNLENDYGTYIKYLILDRGVFYNSLMIAPIFTGGPNNNFYPMYAEGLEIPELDNSRKIVTSLWVQNIINRNLPSGSIIMWSGEEVPEGWALCDGTNETPNLINKFILGDPSLDSSTVQGNENILTYSIVFIIKIKE